MDWLPYYNLWKVDFERIVSPPFKRLRSLSNGEHFHNMKYVICYIRVTFVIRKHPLSTADRIKTWKNIFEVIQSAFACLIDIIYESSQLGAYITQYLKQNQLSYQHFPCAQATFVSGITWSTNIFFCRQCINYWFWKIMQFNRHPSIFILFMTSPFSLRTKE